MHMADALVSPAVGGTMWAATAAATAYCAKKVREEMDDRKVPLMGVLGAFIFAAQMVNFTIPAAGSSGHLGGGMILAILLGPHAAFIVMASVLAVQALFFADGGLLALGCNIINLGVFPCFIGYPLIYRKIVGDNPTAGRITAGALVSAVIGLQLGALGVVLETYFSGVSELPFRTFLFLMQPIHLAIGVVEGLATAAVVNFVWREEPEIILRAGQKTPGSALSTRRILVVFVLLAALCGGVLSWFASTNPDGLEWAIQKVTGREEVEKKGGALREAMGELQKNTALMPDYSLGQRQEKGAEGETVAEKGRGEAGLIGGAVTLALAVLSGWILSLRRKTPAPR